MGQKDYTDWNGRRRKTLAQPPRERQPRRSGKRSNPGIKTLADRYMARVNDIKRYLGKRNDFWAVMAARTGEPTRRHYWCRRWIRSSIRALRKLQEEYRKQGVLERVLEFMR